MSAESKVTPFEIMEDNGLPLKSFSREELLQDTPTYRAILERDAPFAPFLRRLAGNAGILGFSIGTIGGRLSIMYVLAGHLGEKTAGVYFNTAMSAYTDLNIDLIPSKRSTYLLIAFAGERTFEEWVDFTSKPEKAVSVLAQAEVTVRSLYTGLGKEDIEKVGYIKFE